MNNNEKYNINFRLLINEKIIIYILILNGFIIILSFMILHFLSFPTIPLICCIINIVTISIMINYFILTKSKLLLNKYINILQDDLIDEIEEFQTIMK